MNPDPPDPLVLQFAQSHPDDLAVLLVNSGPREVSDLVAGLPAANAARLMARLSSWQMTEVLEILEPQIICRMLLAAGADDAVAVVAHLREARYPVLLQACEPGGQRELRRLLDFPSHSVAALVSTKFIRVRKETLCGAFSEELADAVDTSPKPVLVVDEKGAYRGVLNPLAAIARINKSRPVGDIATAVQPLSGHTDVASALKARQWGQYTALPVVDGRQRIIGVVTRSLLKRVVGQSTQDKFTLERLVSELAGHYVSACARLLEVTLSGKSS